MNPMKPAASIKVSETDKEDRLKKAADAYSTAVKELVASRVMVRELVGLLYAAIREWEKAKSELDAAHKDVSSEPSIPTEDELRAFVNKGGSAMVANNDGSIYKSPRGAQ